MIQCIKIAPYELRPKNQDTYEYLRNLGLQTIDPPSSAAGSIKPAGNFVYCSSLRRAIESVSIRSDQEFIKTDLLKEITFDLALLCTKEEYTETGSFMVRKRFRESFIADTLPISRNIIFKELKNILNQALRHNQDVTLVSHSFRLKILEVYVKTLGRLEQEPELINLYLIDDQKTFAFCEGFIISDKELSMLKI